MSDMSFEVVEYPKQTRSATPNPFADVVAKAAKEANPDQGVAFTTDMGEVINRKRGDGTETVYANVEKAKRLLRQAAPADKSVRVVAQLDTPKKGQARIVFKVTEKIERKPKADADKTA